MEQGPVTTYHDSGWWWNRIDQVLHDTDTALRYATLEEAARIGRRMAERRGLGHVVQHA